LVLSYSLASGMTSVIRPSLMSEFGHKIKLSFRDDINCLGIDVRDPVIKREC